MSSQRRVGGDRRGRGPWERRDFHALGADRCARGGHLVPRSLCQRVFTAKVGSQSLLVPGLAGGLTRPRSSRSSSPGDAFSACGCLVPKFCRGSTATPVTHPARRPRAPSPHAVPSRQRGAHRGTGGAERGLGGRRAGRSGAGTERGWGGAAASAAHPADPGSGLTPRPRQSAAVGPGPAPPPAAPTGTGRSGRRRRGCLG